MALTHGTAIMLEDANFISQIIAAVAIVASLIFVGLQQRHSARAQRAVIEQGRADRRAPNEANGTSRRVR